MQDSSTDIAPAVLLGCAAGAVAVALALGLVALVVTLIISQAAVPDAAPAAVSSTPLPTPTPVTVRNAPPDPARYTWTLVEGGFDNPLYVTHAGDGSGRLFGVEQLGRIWIIEPGKSYLKPFLDISSLLPAEVFTGVYTERGLLGLAFHPDYRRNGLFFVHHTNRDGQAVIARYRVKPDNPNEADPASRQVILTVDDPWPDHNGGNLQFGPDGYLYVGFGDGGNVNEPNYNSQNPALLLGKLLRLDVNADTYTIPPDNPFVNDPDYQPEIWALGLRNPWRYSFDRATGDLYIADVGQWDREEVNFQPAGSPGGENYGWSAWEGTRRHQTDVTPLGEVTWPFFEYSHVDGCSVTGGYVYRGAALPELQGYYFFGDYCTGRVWVSYRDRDGAWQTHLFMETGRTITSFGEDERGELYLVDYKGDILRLEAAPQR